MNNSQSINELKATLRALRLSARDLLRQNEPIYEAAGLENDELSEVQVIEVIVKHPILLQQPIIVNENKAAIGHPLENALFILVIVDLRIYLSFFVRFTAF